MNYVPYRKIPSYIGISFEVFVYVRYVSIRL
jgi:hypothetical protein